MEGKFKGDVSPAGHSNRVAGAAQYLQNLPSQGLFSATVLSTNVGGVRVYSCIHDTSPPEDQVVKTNTTNILIRSLTLKKLKSNCSSKDVKGKATTENAKGKRLAERAADGSTSAKKANMTIGSRREGSHHLLSEKFQSLTVERLRVFLKERGLSTKGKKDELVSRLINDRED